MRAPGGQIPAYSTARLIALLLFRHSIRVYITLLMRLMQRNMQILLHPRNKGEGEAS